MNNINLQIVIYLMGVLLAINSGFMMIASIVSLIFDDGVYLKIFYSSISVLIFGLILMFTKKNIPNKFKREGYIIVSLGWLLMSLSGMIPYLATGSINEFSRAFLKLLLVTRQLVQLF